MKTKQRKDIYRKEIPELFKLLRSENKELYELDRVRYEYEKRIKSIRRKIGIRFNYILDELTPREQKVIECRFGLNGELPMTLEEVGSVFDVTRDRIRQMEGKALAKLGIFL